MQDTFLRTLGESYCPHCDHRMPATPIPMFAGGWSAHHYLCCQCGLAWNEIRDILTTTRYWDAVPAPASRAVPVRG